MAQSIGQKFTPVTLLKFALPSMVMMVLMSCYTITDGIFISRFLGDNALSAVNIVYPVINIVLAIGVMLATGGSAVVAKKMGEGKDDEAKENFSMLVFTGVVASVVILILTILFLEPICRALGANDSLLANSFYRCFICPGVHAAEPVPDVLRDSGKTTHWHDVSHQCRYRKCRVGLCIFISSWIWH